MRFPQNTLRNERSPGHYFSRSSQKSKRHQVHFSIIIRLVQLYRKSMKRLEKQRRLFTVSCAIIGKKDKLKMRSYPTLTCAVLREKHAKAALRKGGGLARLPLRKES